MKRNERVAAVKILSGRRKAAQKFWAPQQDHPALRGHDGRCGACRRGVGDAAPYGSMTGKCSAWSGGTMWASSPTAGVGSAAQMGGAEPPPLRRAGGAAYDVRRGEGTPPYGNVTGRAARDARERQVLFCGIYGRAYDGAFVGEGSLRGEGGRCKKGKDEIPWRK